MHRSFTYSLLMSLVVHAVLLAPSFVRRLPQEAPQRAAFRFSTEAPNVAAGSAPEEPVLHKAPAVAKPSHVGPLREAALTKEAPTQESASAPAGAITTPEAVHSSGMQAAALAAYQDAIRSRIESRLIYPKSLQKRGIQGRVELRLTLASSGALRSIETGTDSSPELQRLARDAVKSAAPFPPFSQDLGSRESLTLRLPIDFKRR